jgi:hypothetical protein
MFLLNEISIEVEESLGNTLKPKKTRKPHTFALDFDLFSFKEAQLKHFVATSIVSVYIQTILMK